eukprot:15343970-Ditylum_brightwellii.AAC.1
MSHLWELEQKWDAVLVVEDSHDCRPPMGLHGVPYFFAPSEMVFILWVCYRWTGWHPQKGCSSPSTAKGALVLQPVRAVERSFTASVAVSTTLMC